MADNEDVESPATNMIRTASGNTYDMNNISGAMRRQLIRTKELNVDQFTVPDNMPGQKLRILREQAREQMKVFTDELVPVENLYKVGDLVNFKGLATEVKEVDSERGVKVLKEDGGDSKWIPFDHKSLKFQKDIEGE